MLCPTQSPEPNNQPELLTIRDFAIRYRVSVPTIYRLRERGKLAFVHIGRSTRIRRADAEAWAASLTGNGGDHG